MAVCPPRKIDSNNTGLRIAEERCLGELPFQPVWKVQEPNSYSDLGGGVTTVARNPINPSRQRRKGVVTDLEAGGGYNQDLTIRNSFFLFQGLLFADAREHGTTDSLVVGQPLPLASVSADDEYVFPNAQVSAVAVAAGGSGYRVGDVLNVTGGGPTRTARAYVAAVSGSGAVTSILVDEPGIYASLPSNPASTSGGSGSGATLNLTPSAITTFRAGDIVLASGFGTGANNGIKTVASQTGGTLEVDEALTAEASPPATATLQTVGHTFAAEDVSITLNGLLARLTNEDAVDFTTFGLIPGEWIYLDGFANNGGFARIGAIAAGYIEFDKTDWIPVAEAETGVTATVYFGVVIRNESDPSLIKRRTYQLERTLGQDTFGMMSEYVIGSLIGEWAINISEADKIAQDFTYVGIDAEHRSGQTGVKPGARPLLPLEDAYNTSSDFSRIKLALASETDSAVQPLFAFATDITLNVNNNVSPNRAAGYLGAIDMTAGTLTVDGSLTAYFANVEAVQAVRNNADVTLDFIIVKNNAGFLVDIPLITLGNGRITVEQDQAVTLPLDTGAAESKFGHTILFQWFPYLPASAG